MSLSSDLSWRSVKIASIAARGVLKLAFYCRDSCTINYKEHLYKPVVLQSNTTPTSRLIIMNTFLKSVICAAFIGSLAACGGGSDSQQVTNCSLSGTAPIVPAQTGIVGTAFSQTLINTGTAPTGCAISFSGTSLPPGLSIRANDGLISGVPTTAGRFNSGIIVTVRSTDGGSGDSRSVPVTFTITAAAAATSVAVE